MPQTMRTHVGRIRDRTYHFMHDSADDPLVNSSATGAQEQRPRRVGTRESGTPLLEPAAQGSLRRHPIGNHALLGPLAKYPDQAPLLVEVIQVKPAKLGDTYPGRVQQLDGCVITQCKRVRLGGTALRGVQRGASLFGMQYRREGSPGAWRYQPGSWVAGHQPGAGCPSRESASCSSAPGQCATSVPSPVLPTQPAAQQRQIQRIEVIAAGICHTPQQCGDITAVGTHGVRRQPSH